MADAPSPSPAPVIKSSSVSVPYPQRPKTESKGGAMRIRRLRIAAAGQWVYDAAKRLGLGGIGNGPWSGLQIKSMGQIARYLSTGDTLPAMLMVDAVKQLGMLDAAMEEMQARLRDPIRTYDDKMANVAAAKAMAELAKVHREKTALVMELTKMLSEGKGEDKKRNLPPTVALQVNVAGGANSSPPPAISANNGTVISALPPRVPGG